MRARCMSGKRPAQVEPGVRGSLAAGHAGIARSGASRAGSGGGGERPASDCAALLTPQGFGT